jgi:hypothetical protein
LERKREERKKNTETNAWTWTNVSPTKQMLRERTSLSIFCFLELLFDTVMLGVVLKSVFAWCESFRVRMNNTRLFYIERIYIVSSVKPRPLMHIHDINGCRNNDWKIKIDNKCQASHYWPLQKSFYGRSTRVRCVRHSVNAVLDRAWYWFRFRFSPKQFSFGLCKIELTY